MGRRHKTATLRLPRSQLLPLLTVANCIFLQVTKRCLIELKEEFHITIMVMVAIVIMIVMLVVWVIVFVMVILEVIIDGLVTCRSC